MDEYIGIVKLFAGNFAPRGWLFCSGQILPISQYSTLYSLLGVSYGGDGVTTFALPDLRSRVPLGASDMGAAPGLPSHPRGDKGGIETTVLNSAQLPAHTHGTTVTAGSGTAPTVSVMASNQAPTQSTPGAGSPAANTISAVAEQDGGVTILGYNSDASPSVSLNGVTVSGGGSGVPTVTVLAAGSSSPVSIMQPYGSLNYIICIEGVYPSRP